jgi:hypothetical protein
LGRLLTELSKLKPSPSDDAIVELRPPDGNSVTHKIYRSDAEGLKLFLSKGYTIVDTKESAA